MSEKEIVCLVPRKISPFNKVYNVVIAGKSTNYKIITHYHFVSKLFIHNISVSLAVTNKSSKGLVPSALLPFFDLARPSYTLYNGEYAIATAKSGFTKNGRFKMELYDIAKNKKFSINRDASKIIIRNVETKEKLCEIESPVPNSDAIKQQVCGYEIIAEKAAQNKLQFTTSSGTKLKMFDTFHSRSFCIKQLKNKPLIPRHIMWLVVYFWERNSTISLAAFAPTGLLAGLKYYMDKTILEPKSSQTKSHNKKEQILNDIDD
jgi:hypothetical protein